MKLPWSWFCSFRCLQITASRQRHDTTAQDKSLAEQPTLLTPGRAADTSASPHLASTICRPAPSRKPAGQHLYFAHSHDSPFLSGTWHCPWPESCPALPGATHVVANATDLDSRQKRLVAVNQQGCRFLAGEGELSKSESWPKCNGLAELFRCKLLPSSLDLARKLSSPSPSLPSELSRSLKFEGISQGGSNELNLPRTTPLPGQNKRLVVKASLSC